MLYQDLGERKCLSCKATIELCLEVGDTDTATPPPKEIITYKCPHCSDEVADRVIGVWGNTRHIPKGFVVAKTEWE